MATERIRRRIEQLLDEADQAVVARNWGLARDRASDVLACDPANTDAKGYLAAAKRALGPQSPVLSPFRGAVLAEASSAPPPPTSFASGHFPVKRFLGEGGKKKVYLAHDTVRDRDVAFGLIKTEGLDDAAKTRITR